MFVVASALYYGRVFGGGDAKLLMGFGVVLPYAVFKDLFILGGEFIIVLFLIGAVYSLVISIGIAFRKRVKFRREFLIGLGV